MSRPDKDCVFLEIAKTVGQLGTCDRARVGAVLVRDGRCISWGFNGAPSGLPHCDENDHGWRGHFAWAHQNAGKLKIEALEKHGCRNATHAEANAIAFAARQGISTEGCTLYVERTPCLECSRLIIACGIEDVICYTEYRDASGRELLQQAGIEVLHLDDGVQ